ncbi:MAG: DNA (cytosine-5-)-methyltransferase [Enhydrobacter sp.]|nr:DNA (cytosine-5-)-methyltransferase [Enhydrobacter sp.]
MFWTVDVYGRVDSMKISALFAGIGGLELGLNRAGHKSLMMCEIWDPAVAVLRQRFASIPIERDVASLKDLPSSTELLTAGFPCQDLSQAGLTAGIEGKRSGLVDHVFRLLDKQRVKTIVLENVSFMLALDKGAAMHRLTGAFEERGYRWAYRTVNSLAFVPQRRERVFFVASCGDLEPENVLFGDDVVPPTTETKLATHAHGFYWTEGTRGLGWAPDAIPTLKNGSTIGIPSPPAVLMPAGQIIKPDIRDAEHLQGFPEGWTTSAPERLRWSLVGNAVTVPVAEWLGGRLLEPSVYDTQRDRPWETSSKRFPRAARFDGLTRYGVEISGFPVWQQRLHLHQFLKYSGMPLSVRATSGFLSRAEASSLRFVPGFLAAVRSHLERMHAAPVAHSSVTSGTGLIAAE